MAVGDRPDDGPIEEANSKLAQGLKSCRAVMQNYRLLLANGMSEAKARTDRAGNFRKR